MQIMKNHWYEVAHCISQIFWCLFGTIRLSFSGQIQRFESSFDFLQVLPVVGSLQFQEHFRESLQPSLINILFKHFPTLFWCQIMWFHRFAMSCNITLSTMLNLFTSCYEMFNNNKKQKTKFSAKTVKIFVIYLKT